MAEFRKREDITQEIDLLQQWSDLGAPRMGELSPNLRHLVKTVDPGMASKIEIRTQAGPPPADAVPSGVPVRPLEGDDDWPPEQPPPPEFADLPPGDDERSGRSVVLPVVAVILLLAGAAALWLTKDRTVAPVPSPDPSGEAGQGHHGGEAPLGTAAPSAAAPTAHAAPPTAAPTAHATAIVPAGVPTAAHGETPPGAIPETHATATVPAASPHGATAPHPSGAHAPLPPVAKRSPLPGLRPVKPVVRAKPKVTEYVVRLGDSLSLIAMRELGEMERWTELHEMNRVGIADPDLILPGQKITLPGEGAEPPAEVAYTSQPGDTLQDLAARHLGDGGRWRELYEMNRERLPAQTVLPPGTELRLPAAPDAGAGPEPRRPGLRATGKPRHHVVRHGESLSLLARRYLGSAARWPELYYLNRHKIAHAHWVYPGQVLAIPPAHGGRALKYVVRSGDTLWAIAATHMNSPFRWPKLWRANHDRIANPHWIYPGQIFRVPN